MSDGVLSRAPGMAESWYEVIEGAELEQGDVLIGCPVLVPIEADIEAASAEGGGGDEPSEVETLAVEEAIRDVVVMTQSCDLVNDKVQDVLVAEVIEWASWVRAEADAGRQLGKNAQEGWRKKLVRGQYPALSLLHDHGEEPSMGWSIVDFRKLYTVRKELLEQRASDS